MRPKLLVVCLLAILLQAAPESTSLSQWKLFRTVSLKAQTHHVQGIDTDGKTLWVTAVDTPSRKGYLYEFAADSGELRRSLEVQDGERFHPGGLSADAQSIWAPVAEYRASSTSIVQRRNKRTLAVEVQFAVADHIGCLAVTPQFVVGGNWDSKDFYVWNHKGELIRKVASSTGNAYQDMKFDGKNIVASGLLPGRKGAIDWLDVETFRLIRRMEAGNTDSGAPYTREGMTIRGNELWFLPEDDQSRLFLFRQ